MNPRIRRYIDQAPEAISGQGGHNTTLRVARSLYNGFALSRDQVFECLQVYNSRLVDKWTDRELMHKAEAAASGAYDKPRGWMLATDATDVRYTQPSAVVVRAAKKTPIGVKTGKKYVLATDATDVRYTQPSLTHARAHARACQELEISVATVANCHSQPHQDLETSVASGADREDTGEAHRTAGELLKMYQDGVIKGADDPEAPFCIKLLHTFGGTYRPRHPEKKEDATGPYVPTKEQRVVVPPGLTAKERQQFLQDDLDSAFGE